MLADLSQSERELAEYMSSISEDAYAAAWIEGLEFELWRAVQEIPFRYGRLQLTSVHAKRLKEMSQNGGGWIRFDEKTEEQFVPLSAWLAQAGKT
ncbi:MAG TPA: hypothetical protein PK586_00825 [Casimicrobium sp.]|nr:hypothetical protein [Casimicrobium sp.]